MTRRDDGACSRNDSSRTVVMPKARDASPDIERRCTVEFDTGRFCNQPSLDDMPFPICRSHALKLFIRMRDIVGEALADPEGMREAVEATRLAHYDDLIGPHLTWVQRRSPQVYYGRLSDLIKIGTTGFMKQRMHAYPPGFVVLATEPGGTEVEAQRHRQFTASRVGRGEWFRPTADLLAHIEALAEAEQAAS